MFMFVTAGVIDQDYRGNVGVVMFNFSEADFEGYWFKTKKNNIV